VKGKETQKLPLRWVSFGRRRVPSIHVAAVDYFLPVYGFTVAPGCFRVPQRTFLLAECRYRDAACGFNRTERGFETRARTFTVAQRNFTTCKRHFTGA
jgi:hypothetical protein